MFWALLTGRKVCASFCLGRNEKFCASTVLAAARKLLPGAAEWSSHCKLFVCNFGAKLPARVFGQTRCGMWAKQQLMRCRILWFWVGEGTQDKLHSDSSFLVACMVSIGQVRAAISRQALQTNRATVVFPLRTFLADSTAVS